MNIVLLEPEIPSNTGNIGRTCLLTNSTLHLIKPLGFTFDDKHLKRAGMDYWHDVDCIIYENIEEFYEKNIDCRFFYATTKTKQSYSDIKYKKNDFIFFGKESKGIPESILEKNIKNCITIPMNSKGRSLNLSNAVAIILYEGFRQIGFDFGEEI
jgi:tRNA (cytidine/uridine-2'-O-)-methyltransferase